jgi:FixJ family two-component response regulator
VTADASVYVVDDQPEVRKGLERLLRASGLQVELFPSAQEFLVAVGEDKPGCVILDYHAGRCTARRWGVRSWVARVQIVFLTGHGDIRRTVRAMQGGAVDFLEKPASSEQLLPAVQRALEREAAQRAERTEVDDVRARIAQLSPRERQVMGHVIAGRLNKQIAGLLGPPRRR